MRVNKKIWPYRGLKWGLLLLALSLPQAMPAQWKAAVGAQSKDLGRQALAFLPNEIWIHEGESITWTFETDEIHTVSFLQAGQVRLPFQVGCPGAMVNNASFDGSSCVTTPPLVNGQTFTVQFPLRGNYKLVCLVHENMTGTVHVMEPAATLPFAQEDYDDLAAHQRTRLLADVDKDQKETSAHHHSSKHVTTGTGEVVATAGGSQTLSVMRFLNDTIVIHAEKRRSGRTKTRSRRIRLRLERNQRTRCRRRQTSRSMQTEHCMQRSRRYSTAFIQALLLPHRKSALDCHKRPMA